MFEIRASIIELVELGACVNPATCNCTSASARCANFFDPLYACVVIEDRYAPIPRYSLGRSLVGGSQVPAA
jgi:hypothetical protein